MNNCGFAFSMDEWELFQLSLLPPPPCSQGIYENEMSNSMEEWEFFEASLPPPPPPCFQENPQRSNLEILLENMILTQTKQNEDFRNQMYFLNDTLIELTSKVDSIATHSKMLENQITQVAQQVVSSSRSSGIFPGQLEPIPKAQLNVVTPRSGKQLEEPKGNNEKSIVVEKDQNNYSVVVQDKPKEKYHEMESIRDTQIPSLDKYNVLNSFKDVIILCPLSYFSPSFVKITFDLGGIQNRILLLTLLPFYKPWDPGICFHFSHVTWSLCFKQWDPGISP